MIIRHRSLAFVFVVLVSLGIIGTVKSSRNSTGSDANGDGKADIIAVQPNPDRFVVWTSTGSSFNGGQEWLKEFPTTWGSGF